MVIGVDSETCTSIRPSLIRLDYDCLFPFCFPMFGRVCKGILRDEMAQCIFCATCFIQANLGRNQYSSTLVENPIRKFCSRVTCVRILITVMEYELEVDLSSDH